MKCSSCGKENKLTAKFCKHCGSKFVTEYKTCSNGHNYDANLSVCPYCPSPVVTDNTSQVLTDAKTIIDKPELKKTTTNTLPETSYIKQKTTITQNQVKPTTTNTFNSENRNQHASKKIMGWIISFDLDPNGLDFRLFEGRTKIGRNPSNDIVINRPEVSDEHALLVYKDGKYILQDLLSANGTMVNTNLVNERTELHDNDEIKIGTITFRIKII